MAFRKPQENKIGGKFLAYGLTHEGKSWFGLTFPKVAGIDSEAGLAFDEGKDIEIGGKKYNNLVLVDTTSNLDDLEENIDAIIEGEVECDSLLIDSESKFYSAMDIGATEIEERKARQSGKNVDARSKWGRIKQINTKLQQAKITLSSKGKHVVSTAQALEIKDDNGKVTGYKPDVHKSLPFDYDIVLRFFVEQDKKTKERKFYAEVLKDRTHTTKPGDIIENCTYDVWKSHFENKKGDVVGANFSKDLKQSVTSVMNNAEQSENLAKNLKPLIKQKSEENKDNVRVIKEKMDELKIDIRQLDLMDFEVLQKMTSFVESL